MKDDKLITLLSTFAIDKVIDGVEKKIHEQKGGPALYLSHVFNEENILFKLKSPSPVDVEILVTGGGEYGRVPKKPVSMKINFSKIKTPFLVISTLLDEYNLDGASDFSGKIFLDIQGYVREGKNFGKKKKWKPLSNVIKNIFCLKGTDEELKYIPREFLEKQKQKILIRTRGRLGCEVFTEGQRYRITPLSIVDAENTIGAGDAFFAYFISEFIRSNSAYQSAQYATEKTSKFLKSKTTNYNN